MEELNKLLKIVTKGVNLKQALPIDKSRSSKENNFINNLEIGKYISDRDASIDIYGKDPSDVRYKMLKHRLKKKLYNSLLFIDYSKLGLKNYYQREHECLTLLHQAYILRRQYELDLVITLANKVIVIAEQFDFTNHIVTALELKASCYSENGNIKMFNESLKELEKQTLKKNKELDAVSLLQTVNIYLRKSVTTRKNLLPKIPAIVSSLESLWQQTKSFSTFEAYYKTSIYYYELKGDFDKIVEMTINSLKWVEEGVVNAMLFDANYNKFILVYAHLRSKKYTEGLKYAEAYSNDFKFNSVNWFSFMENYFLLSLHSRKYELSNILLQKVFSNTSYKTISNSAKERWSLYQAYYEIVSRNSGSETNIFKNPYSLSLPEYSKDKLGFNVAILILQLDRKSVV